MSEQRESNQSRGRRSVPSWSAAALVRCSGLGVRCRMRGAVTAVTALWVAMLGLFTSAGLAAPVQVGATAQTAVVWDVSSDFAVAPDQANPNPDSYGHRGVWRFLDAGLDHDPSGYALLTEFITNRFGGEGLQGWQGDLVSGGELDKLPHVSINSTSENAVSTVGVDWPPGTVLVHPTADRAVAVGWRSPITGRVSISGSLVDRGVGCGDGVAWWIDRGDSTLTSGAFGDGGAQDFSAGSGGAGALVNVEVREGQKLYFMVSPGPNGDYCADNTQLDILIQLPKARGR